MLQVYFRCATGVLQVRYRCVTGGLHECYKGGISSSGML